MSLLEAIIAAKIAGRNGNGQNGNGDGYVLTPADKEEIAGIVAGLVEVPSGESVNGAVLLCESIDVDVRKIAQDFDSQYSGYYIQISDACGDGDVTWTINLVNPDGTLDGTRLSAITGTHGWHSFAWFYIEPIENIGAYVRMFYNQTAGNYATYEKDQNKLHYHPEGYAGFEVLTDNTEVTYTSLEIRIWGVKT